jgi:hypothetical protein
MDNITNKLKTTYISNSPLRLRGRNIIRSTSSSQSTGNASASSSSSFHTSNINCSTSSNAKSINNQTSYSTSTTTVETTESSNLNDTFVISSPTASSSRHDISYFDENEIVDDDLSDLTSDQMSKLNKNQPLVITSTTRKFPKLCHLGYYYTIECDHRYDKKTKELVNPMAKISNISLINSIILFINLINFSLEV